MLAAVRSAAVLGVDAYGVTVEVDCARGLPNWTIVGLPASSVKESRERVSAALANVGVTIPPRRITCNLAPADVAKTGTAFDLPIAVALLVALELIPAQATTGALFLGELGLDGNLRGVRGVLPVARMLRRHESAPGARALVIPPANLAEAALVGDVRLCAPTNLGDLVKALSAGALPDAAAPPTRADRAASDVDLADVVGQEAARRALEIAAAGGHNLLLVGPPGAGKTMLARRLPTILPSPSEDETLEITAIHSVAGLFDGASGSPARPFRAPHHSVSMAGLVGGGSPPRPGEVSLAHHGVLFLDELLEFPRQALEALRQPMEDGRVTIARARHALSYPARFLLMAAMNPCPCGFHGDDTRVCACSEEEVRRYRARLSGPLLDRIDLHLTLRPVRLRDLGDEAGGGECSSVVRARVEAARAAQRERYAALPRVSCNAQAPGRLLLRELPRDARDLLETAAQAHALSARAYHRVLRVARTIADLGGGHGISVAHVAESLWYRPGVRG